MKFSSLVAVAIAIASSHFAEAHDVRTRDRGQHHERSHIESHVRDYSGVRTGSKGVDESRGKPGKREHHVKHKPKAGTTSSDDEPLMIVGGTTADVGEFPYYVKISKNGGCGGSLIAPGVVLSAAHCEEGVGSLVGWQVVVGAYDTFDNTSNGAQVITITETKQHPQWNFDELVWDVMLMKLDSDKTANGSVKLELNTDDSVPSPGQMMTVIGMGRTHTDGSHPDKLKEVDIPYVDGDTCGQQWGQAVGHDVEPHESFLCGGGVEGEDFCNDDSGGPVVVKEGSIHRLVGAPSFRNGVGCAAGIPSVSVRISAAFPWIKEVVCDEWNVAADFCGGNSTPTPPPTDPPGTGGCTNLAGWTDSYGDDCSYYENNEDGCHNYATDVGTDGKTPVDACCVCKDYTPPTGSPPAEDCAQSGQLCQWELVGDPSFYMCVCRDPPTGSPPNGDCTNLSGWTDSYGDGCEWYEANEGGCQDYATDQGTDGKTPVDACCVCQGDGSPPSGSPPTGSPPTGGCTNLSGWTDSFGNGCDWYESTATGCYDYWLDVGTDGKTPVDACCVCQ